MSAAVLQNFFCFESLVNSVIAFFAMIGISIVGDFWTASATHQFPGREPVVEVREPYIDGSPSVKKSVRITYGRSMR